MNKIIGQPANGPQGSSTGQGTYSTTKSATLGSSVHVKTNQRFRVIYTDAAGRTYPDLTMNTFSVQGLLQDRHCSSGEVIIEIEDDQNNNVCDNIQTLFVRSGFTIDVEYLDGNENVLRTHRLRDCEITTVYHGDLDFSSYDTLKKTVSVAYSTFDIL